MRRTLFSRIAAVAFVSLLSAPAAQAALISSTWTRGDGKTVVQFTGGSDNWTVPAGVTALEVLVVGGGGSGAAYGSGGGAGGLYYTGTSSLYSVTPGSSVSVAVGAGGNGTADGGTSQFDQLLAYGGWSFGAADGYRPLNTIDSGTVQGASQGGYSTNGGFTIIPGTQGVNLGFNGQFYSGAGAVGTGSIGNGSAGGNGIQIAITGTSLYYAGGGGACTAPGLGGLGGGGNSATVGGAAGSPGVNGLGGGGGGGLTSVVSAGGSGVVTVAYVTAVPEPASVALALCGSGLGLAVIRRRRKG